MNKAWPLFLDHDAFQVQFADKVLEQESLRRFQFAIMESDADGGESIIAHARSIPFFWPELDEVRDMDGTLSTLPHVLHTLPDRGWDSIVARGFRQHFTREGLPIPCPPQAMAIDQDSDPGASCSTTNTPVSPNALSALSITVRADRRNCGFAETLIEALKQVAREEGLRVLVAPLRPTRKSEYPWMPMEKYINCTLSESPTSRVAQATQRLRCRSLGLGKGGGLPFDPWLRKHVRLGGTLVKIAPSSMIVRGSFAEWQAWTGIDFYRLTRALSAQAFQFRSDSAEGYSEVAIPGGLVPLKVFAREETCTYTEPNVWLYHDVGHALG